MPRKQSRLLPPAPAPATPPAPPPTEQDIIIAAGRYLPDRASYDQAKRTFADDLLAGTVEQATTFGQLEALLEREELVRLLDDLRTWADSGEATLAEFAKSLAEYEQRYIKDLTEHTPWRHDSTSYMRNLVNLANATARVEAIWAIRRARITIDAMAPRLVPEPIAHTERNTAHGHGQEGT